jgi:hypothetical protein
MCRCCGPPDVSPSMTERSRAAGSHCAGFIMLEFLAAFVIFAAIVSAFLAALSAAIRADQQALFRTRAAMLAKSKLAAAGIEYPIRPGIADGRFDNGYVWRVEMQFERPTGNGARLGHTMVRIHATVGDPMLIARRTLTLSSVKLVGTGEPVR